jgi:colicin import membrane protein
VKAEAAEMADHLSTELESSKIRLAALEAAEQSVRREAQRLQDRLTITTERATTAEARAMEIERRADDLNAELTCKTASNIFQETADYIPT